jgi:copper chaperone
MHRYKVPEMSCEHCAQTVEKAVKRVDPQAAVIVDLDAKEVTVRTEAQEVRIADAIRSAGYETQRLGT